MIEKNISQYIEKQFPAFYQDEGPQFISFVKAYYEWLEQPDNVLNKARHLLEYRDIDTTLDEFLLYFKEKYLKNIQFDTATNKQLLVKHSLDLYRSKGTERSIDLFFKLVFGTAAEVQYPGERIFKLSDGIWEVPKYLEITHNKYNINYVGRQIVGAASGATAFVERYIRRRAGYGYVNMLYISSQVGEFTRGEVIGIRSSGRSVFTPGQTAAIVGSIESVILQDYGRDFAIGDIVKFQHSNRGIGGLARVTTIGEDSGIIDFILHEGGWGYTTNATSIISEKVVTANGVVGTIGDAQLQLFDVVVQPTLSIEFTNGPQLVIGDIVGRYDGANLIANGQVVEIEKTAGLSNGSFTLSVTQGPFTEGTLYVNGNTISLNATSITDTSTYADVMGVPSVYQLTVSNTNGNFTIGMNVFQTISDRIYAHGTISGVSNGMLVISAGIGNFSNGANLISSVNNSVNAVVSRVDTTLGLHQINKRAYTLDFVGANNNGIANSGYLFQYDALANVVSSGLALHSSVSSNAGTIEYVPIYGQIQENLLLYTTGNTAVATVTNVSCNVYGGDFVEAANAAWRTSYTNTTFTVASISEGTGAQFDVGAIGETEVIFVGTDLINSNGVSRVDYDRKRLSIASNTGFQVGQTVRQYNAFSATFNPTTQVAANGLITASNIYNAGDWVLYTLASGNTAVVEANTAMRVLFANSTTLRVAGPGSDDTLTVLGTVSETGHRFSKIAVGTVYGVGSGYVDVKDTYNAFVATAGTNTVLTVHGTSVNSSITAVASAASTPNVPGSNYRHQLLRKFAFGLPKDPQVGLRDIIFDCLSFDRFEIGVVDSLSGVDPGSDYNVDPYVLVEQPEIAGFSRRDYVMDIANSVATFVVGEKISHAIANLTTYVLTIDYGTFGNTYTNRNILVQSNNEVVSADDFIYYPANTLNFNPGSDVNPFTGVVSLENDLEAGETVRYYTATGNTALYTNNAFLTVTTANSSTLTLSNTSTPTHVTTNAAAIVNNFLSITSNPYANDTPVRYVVASGNTAILGLDDGKRYYAVYSNSTGTRLSATLAGAVLELSAGGSESGHALVGLNSLGNGHNYVIYRNEYDDNERVLYTTATGNTAITGLSNNTTYYVKSANTVGFKLSATVGGAAVGLTASVTESGHIFNSIPGWLPLEGIYSNSGAYGVIDSVGNNSLVIRGVSNGTFAAPGTIASNTNAYLTANVSTSDLEVVTRTSEGIIKSANTSCLTVKRIQFENNWVANTLITGETTGATALLTSINEDQTTLQIGLNANVEADVVTAEGQATTLKIIDSGFGYTNSEIIQFTSTDGARAGSAKVVLGGTGKGVGYYKSSKGFLSDSVCIHDGDYYQEYSYEIFSKLSLDRYRDMFKKVMHTAGTKFFGTARVVEEDTCVVSVVTSSVEQE